MKPSNFLGSALVWVIIISSPNANSQDLLSRKYSVTGTVAILSPRYIAIQPGFGFRFRKQWELLMESAIPVSVLGSSKFQPFHMFRVTEELKFINRKNSPWYFSFQLGYVRRKGTDADSGVFEQAKTYQWFSYEKAKVHTPVVTIALKTGKEITGYQGMIIDIFTGVGWRFIFTNYKAEGLKPRSRIRRPDAGPEVLSVPALEFNGTLSRFHFVMGMRVGLGILHKD